MDRAALIADLSARFGPRAVITDRALIAPWLSDWRGRYHGAADAILAPATAREAAAMVAAAHAAGVALVPQGGNTSMVGGATPPEDGSALIISTRRMTSVRHIAADHAVAEAGVVLQTFHEAAAARGLRFPLTLGAKGSATLGGLASTNAGGTQVLRFGTMRSLVLGVEAVLPDGSMIDTIAPLRKDTRGYDLRHLLVGAEGTLGLITALSLRLIPAIGARTVAWAGVAGPADALALLRRMEAGGGEAIESFEIIPGDSLALVLAHVPGARSPLAGTHPWHVLIEAVSADAGDPPQAMVERLLSEALAAGLIADAAIAKSEAEAEAFWHLRDSLSAAERAAGPAVQHDIAVPVEAMPAFMVDAARAAEARFPGTHATAFGHLGDGNVHFHVRAAPGADAAAFHAGQAAEITRFVHDAVIAAGGTISAEHGIGQMKLAELARVEAPARLKALIAIKRAIDPLGLMNPGKLVPLAPGDIGP
ncbi:FAD-binding oxidoreductase [Sphingomonas gilva]|uniref:FAD-binding oxidoreductase n=1 Tax=Sphingomonas gilva TaxID=2305907 RepID=A0A396RWQ7_9SPHN|nr:FAD-binding oxidoreductase [Sphingomonas gilva]RHW18903.1 FAD-binding oxidoreductase [Sphingomonas gilva]